VQIRARAPVARPAALVRPAVHAALIELVATAFLLIAVVGSGIMAQRLSPTPRASRCLQTRLRRAADSSR
jgi:hypothetical protein